MEPWLAELLIFAAVGFLAQLIDGALGMGYGVISATVLFWLGDESEGRADTRAFIDRRIDGVMSVETVKARLRSLPGASRLADAALGWIRAPRDRALPGKTR